MLYANSICITLTEYLILFRIIFKIFLTFSFGSLWIYSMQADSFLWVSISPVLHNISSRVGVKSLKESVHFLLFSCVILWCSVNDVMKKLQEYIDDINANIEKLDCRGPVSKYVLPDENLRGRSVGLSLSLSEWILSQCCIRWSFLILSYFFLQTLNNFWRGKLRGSLQSRLPWLPCLVQSNWGGCWPCQALLHYW